MELQQRNNKLKLCVVDCRHEKEAFIKHFSRGKPKMEEHLDKMIGTTSFFLRNKTDDFILLDMGITQAS